MDIASRSRLNSTLAASFLSGQQFTDRCLSLSILLRKPYGNSRPAFIRRESTPYIDALPQKRRREIHVRNFGFEEYEIAGRYGKVQLQFPQYAEPDFPSMCTLSMSFF
jgi:hypothetical protein